MDNKLKIRFAIIFLSVICISFFSISCGRRDNDKNSKSIEEKLGNEKSLDNIQKQKLKGEQQNDDSYNEIIQMKAYEPISEYETPILDNSEGRVYNLNLASSKLTGYKVESGEVFSFNNVVGEADEKNGFKKAKVIIQKKAIIDDGGGVCQVSSTLYNSALIAGMEIIERHSHSRDVGYIDEGKDAAISYGEFDLKFKNTKPFPVKIEAYIKDGHMVVKLWNGEY